MAQATSQEVSTASRYGVQADELSALITAAVSNTHESGIEIGNALNAIFANLQDTASRPIQKTFDAVCHLHDGDGRRFPNIRNHWVRSRIICQNKKCR